MHPILLQLGPWTFDVPVLLVGALVGAIVGLIAAQSKGESGKRAAIGAALGLVGGVVLAALTKGTGSIHVDKWEPTIHTFGPLVALGAFTGILYVRREGRRRGIDPELLTGFSVEVLLVGVAGSRVLFCLITKDEFPILPERSWFENYILQYLAIWKGGLVWYGGMVPAAIFGMLRAKQLGIPVGPMCDVLSPCVMFGLSIGRMGCLMAGDDHGMLVESGEHWWTVTFTNEKALVLPVLLGKPLWPSQPQMSIGAFLIGMICHFAGKRLRERPGAVMIIMMILYPIHRFFVELTRGDSVRKFLVVFDYMKDEHGHYLMDPRTGEKIAATGISTSQAISIPLVLISIAVLVWMIKRPAKAVTSAPLPAPPSRWPQGAAIVACIYTGLAVGFFVARRLEVANALAPAIGYVLCPAVAVGIAILVGSFVVRALPPDVDAPAVVSVPAPAAPAAALAPPAPAEPAAPTTGDLASPPRPGDNPG